ncbi:hypothetical protein GLOIN_2v1879318 [Rhizophagus irregularis DAOM 181602=DAOM 197198]|uniref:F-box domain-containing protein n=1 Tax=Rhizophagus irregularis (strain DAOM 181602 / DAOM 197198 / MUCL 43194) TaxID=747089 RepID=A0A2P4PP80_RHIID|nr:hypothetical protein GLOIN_2v1879318 [Rhizophagus irregularis DAOM 181602=DAOM 197198]POG67183.1 hypothetical protein GLOIN_2v1879318 [Rhizophagus irregularis DAOM 181602=DAOM 197198]|eukprot:XP_025174049.1 hypothetical protein GLOIN_2v1879318 [Rhizophagus irregularis DAOM 181602=DAOM 197198]
MACSKIFSGNMPELTSKIIQYLQYDHLALHSCIFVNRLWCRIAIPLLWEDPFSKKLKLPKNQNILEPSLYKLNEDDKTRLNEFGINNETFSLNTLFNYSSFIKCLDTYTFVYSVKKWIKTKISVNIMESTKFIFMLLIKIFIENGISLHTFEVEVPITLSVIGDKCFNSTFELILKNPNFINNVKNLILHFSERMENMEFLERFYYNCNSISSLHILASMDEDEQVEKNLSQIIKSQQNLKKISFEYHFEYTLNYLKDSYCLNTLKTIIFYGIRFNSMVDFKEVFEQLNVLESVHILDCYSLNSVIIEQIINLSKPFKLKSLFINEILDIKSLESLLQKSGDYIEYFGLRSRSHASKQQLLEVIKRYCTRIKFFELFEFDKKELWPTFDLIEDVGQNLNFISIDLHEFYIYQLDHDTELSSIILQNLGQILPHKLEYLNLAFKINTNDLGIFFKNSQNIFIKKLLIKNKIYNESEDILPYIKEYVMKEKRVMYLAMEESFGDEKKKNLFSLEDEVKEFQLHNIKIQNYNDLLIDIYDFVNENKREVVGRRNAGNLATKLYENSTPEEVVDVISKLRKESSEDMNKRMDKRIELIERKSNGNYEITKSDCQQRGKK